MYTKALCKVGVAWAHVQDNAPYHKTMKIMPNHVNISLPFCVGRNFEIYECKWNVILVYYRFDAEMENLSVSTLSK